MKYSVLLSLVFSFTVFAGGSKRPHFEAKINTPLDKVIIIGIDGLGSRNLKSRSLRGKTPNIKRLREMSAWTHSATIDRENFSGPNWAGIFTGSGSKVTGVNSNKCVKSKVPTIFDLIKSRRKDLKIDFIYEEWTPVTCYAQDTKNYDTLTRFTDPETITDKAVEIINTKNFNLINLYYVEVDESGHRTVGNSKEYNAEVIKVDKAIGRILDSLKNNDLLSSTLIIMVSDHGHFRVVNGHSTRLHKVPLYISGPGVVRGKMRNGILKHKVLRNLHVAPIIAHFLGLSTPTSWEYGILPYKKYFK